MKLAGALGALAAVLAAAPSPAAAPEGKTPLTAELMWQLKRLAGPAISPDGAWAVLPVTSYDVKEDKGKTDLWLLPTAGGEARRLTTHEAGDTNPAFSPDGKWIAFESKRAEDEAGQIYVISTSGGEASRLTNVPTGASAPKWFPDSKRIAFVSLVFPDLKSWDEMAKRIKERKDSKVSAKIWERVPIRYWDHWLDDREAHVYSIGLAGGDPTPVTLGTGLQLSNAEPGVASYDISPDGMELGFAADVDKTGVDSNFDVFVVPAAGGGAARNISSENPADDDAPHYSPDGRFIAFGRRTVKGFYGDRVRLVLHDRKTGANRVVTEKWDRSASALLWTPDSRALYGAIDDAGNQRVYRIDVGSGEPMRITGARSFSSLALSRDGKTLVGLRQGFGEPPTLVRIEPMAGGATKLSSFNDELLAKLDFGAYESVSYKGANGQEIQMWVVYPPGFDAKKKWPLYLLLHGGPHNGITDGFLWRWNAQVFAGWGYVTAWHNFHGSSGFGQAFTDSINPFQSELPYEDTIKAADWFKGQPWIDGERLAAGGGSYGGYLAAIVLGRKHPFKTLVAHAGVYDWFTQYGADYGAEKRRHGEFWTNMEHYSKSSPHFGAGSFNTPTLVIHGERDYRVPANQGIELFNTLQNRGVRSRLIYYPDENHWVLKPQNSIHWYSEKQRWLAELIGT